MMTLHFTSKPTFPAFLLSVLTLCTLQKSALAITIDDIKTWTPPSLHTVEILSKIQTVIHSEQIEPILVEADTKRSFGFSFPEVSPSNSDCLKEVFAQAQADPSKQPQVAEIGAGFGNFSWKLMVAGGKVDAIEAQALSAEKIRDRAMLAKGLLGPGVRVKDRITIYPRDFFSVAADDAFSNKYDITNSSNILHFMTPKRLKSYLAKLFKITRPGGIAFANADAPSNLDLAGSFFNDRWSVDRFFSSRASGRPFPGYHVFNVFQNSSVLLDPTGRFHSPITETEIIQSVTLLEPDSDLDPGEIFRNFHGESGPLQIELAAHPSFPFNPLMKKSRVKVHFALHALDHETLTREFTAAGFVVDQTYYTRLRRDGGGFEKTRELPSPEELKTQETKVAIRAHKPAIE